jgi:hypothetical protein
MPKCTAHYLTPPPFNLLFPKSIVSILVSLCEVVNHLVWWACGRLFSVGYNRFMLRHTARNFKVISHFGGVRFAPFHDTM